jgi:hypothetical protein
MTDPDSHNNINIDRFEPPVDIINDPPGHQTRRHENVQAVKWGQPRSCDAKLDMAYGGEWTVNREFIHIAEDDPHNRSLQMISTNQKGK